MKQLDLAFSPCPNDTFIFHAALNGCIDTAGIEFNAHLFDVEELNKAAFQQKYAITKLSFFAYLKLEDQFDILDSGAALGFGCGPLLVARSQDLDMSKATIAIPGELTTANLLLRLWNPEVKQTVVTRFDDILPGIESGRFDAGVIIHEGRFIFERHGCVRIIDLGEWWEETYQLPIPLGCIAISRHPSVCDKKSRIETIIRESVQFAFQNRPASRDFIKQHSRELDDDVIDHHIKLYVNDFSISLGEKGRNAVETLKDVARCRKILV